MNPLQVSRPPAWVVLLNLLGLPLVALVYYAGIQGARYSWEFSEAGERAALVAAIGVGTNVLLSGWLLKQRRFGLALTCWLPILLYLALALLVLWGANWSKPSG